MLPRLNGLDGHPEIRIPGVEASTGSLGMGISKAKGMAWAKEYNGAKGKVFVLTGDGEWQEGQIYEALQATAHQKVNNITAIIDHNKYQTDMLVKDVNNIEDLTEKVKAFGWHVEKIDGHDFALIASTLELLDKITHKPKLIIADTIKGKGISFMETPVLDPETGKAFYKWHSGAPDDTTFKNGLKELKDKIDSLALSLDIEPIQLPIIEVNTPLSAKAVKEFVTEAYGDALVEMAKTNDKFVVLDGDLSADCKLRKFENTYPNRFIENGIAEQDMVSMAGGLARMGLIPIVNTFASFLSARANEQIYNNATEKRKIIYTCHFAGMIPAGPGKSHQSVRDISLFGALPNSVILQPSNALETKLVTEYCINSDEEVCVIRLNIGPSPESIQLPKEYQLVKGKGVELTSGSDAILFAYGPVLLHEALVAAEYLKKIEFGLKVVNMPWLNKVDSDWIGHLVEDFNKIFVLEDHSIIGGLGDRILNALVNNHDLGSRSFTKLGLVEYPECGTPLEVLEYHKLDGKSLAERIAGLSNIDEMLDTSFDPDAKYTSEAPQ
jgi:transketolase